MHRVRVTFHPSAELDILANASRLPEKNRKEFFTMVDRATTEISQDPTCGKRKVVDGVEVFTLRLRRWQRPAFHYIVYRNVDGGLEVGRVLHLEQALEECLPADWLDKAA